MDIVETAGITYDYQKYIDENSGSLLIRAIDNIALKIEEGKFVSIGKMVPEIQHLPRIQLCSRQVTSVLKKIAFGKFYPSNSIIHKLDPRKNSNETIKIQIY